MTTGAYCSRSMAIPLADSIGSGFRRALQGRAPATQATTGGWGIQRESGLARQPFRGLNGRSLQRGWRAVGRYPRSASATTLTRCSRGALGAMGDLLAAGNAVRHDGRLAARRARPGTAVARRWRSRRRSAPSHSRRSPPCRSSPSRFPPLRRRGCRAAPPAWRAVPTSGFWWQWPGAGFARRRGWVFQLALAGQLLQELVHGRDCAWPPVPHPGRHQPDSLLERRMHEGSTPTMGTPRSA